MNSTRSLVSAVQAYADTLACSWAFGNVVRLNAQGAITGEIEHNGISAELHITGTSEGVQIALGSYRASSDQSTTMLLSHLTRGVEVMHTPVRVNA